jgi:hypothetical protein
MALLPFMDLRNQIYRNFQSEVGQSGLASPRLQRRQSNYYAISFEKGK